MNNETVLSVRLKEMRDWANGARCLVILDTWARATSGYSSNTQEEMDIAYENAEMVLALQGADKQERREQVMRVLKEVGLEGLEASIDIPGCLFVGQACSALGG